MKALRSESPLFWGVEICAISPVLNTKFANANGHKNAADKSISLRAPTPHRSYPLPPPLPPGHLWSFVHDKDGRPVGVGVWYKEKTLHCCHHLPPQRYFCDARVKRDGGGSCNASIFPREGRAESSLTFKFFVLAILISTSTPNRTARIVNLVCLSSPEVLQLDHRIGPGVVSVLGVCQLPRTTPSPQWPNNYNLDIYQTISGERFSPLASAQFPSQMTRPQLPSSCVWFPVFLVKGPSEGFFVPEP